MRHALLIALPAAALLFAGTAAGAGRVECSAVPSAILGREVRYCALLPPSYDAPKSRRYPVLYFLHGLGQNEQSLIDSGGWALVEELQKNGSIGEFLIVTPDGGRSFFINSRDARVRYEDFFIREFVPAIDRRYRTRTGTAGRGISGVSMGGYGALRFGFKYPQMFAAVSAHSAALIEKPPARHSSGGRAGARLSFLEEVFGSPPDAEFWQRNSPFTLARKSAALARLKIYFDCGSEDYFGFEDGNQALSKLLEARHLRHEFHLYPGGHGWSYVAQHLGASLIFHSRAFGLTPRSP